jgi:CRP-like cAMP-binding protein
MMGDRLVRSNLWRLDFQSYDAHARTARVLIEVTRSYPDLTGSGWALPLSQPELASMAGVKLRTLEKELTSLERLGAIKRRYRMVQVTDMKTLFEAAKILDLPQ